MVVVDQGGIGGLEGFLSQEPLAHILQHVDGDAGRALAHGRDAEVRAVRDESGQQGGVDILGAGGKAAEGAKFPAEPTPGINLAQQLFDPHRRQAGLDQAAQLQNPLGELQRVAPMEFQPAFRDRSEPVGAHAGSGFAGDLLEFFGQVRDDLITFAEQRLAPVPNGRRCKSGGRRKRDGGSGAGRARRSAGRREPRAPAPSPKDSGRPRHLLFPEKGARQRE